MQLMNFLRSILHRAQRQDEVNLLLHNDGVSIGINDKLQQQRKLIATKADDEHSTRYKIEYHRKD